MSSKSKKDARISEETVDQFVAYFGLNDLDQHSLTILKSAVDSFSNFGNQILQDVAKLVDSDPTIDEDLGAEMMILNTLPSHETEMWEHTDEHNLMSQQLIEHFGGSEFVNDRSIKIFKMATNYLLNKGIVLMNRTYEIVNSNTTSNTWNSFATAFKSLFNSEGWVALDTAINTVGNIFTIYDATGSAIERNRQRVKDKIKGNAPPDEAPEKLQSSVDELNVELTSIKDLVMLFVCHNILSERDAMTNPLCSDQKEEEEEEEDTRHVLANNVTPDKVVNPVISNKIISQYYFGRNKS
jgi:hypothetical protein